MAVVVIDASIASAWCFPDEQTDYTRAVFQALSSSAVDTVAPRLWAYEIRNSVLMGIRRGRISKPDGEQFLVSMNEMNVRLSEPASYDEVFALAMLANGQALTRRLLARPVQRFVRRRITRKPVIRPARPRVESQRR